MLSNNVPSNEIKKKWLIKLNFENRYINIKLNTWYIKIFPIQII